MRCIVATNYEGVELTLSFLRHMDMWNNKEPLKARFHVAHTPDINSAIFNQFVVVESACPQNILPEGNSFYGEERTRGMTLRLETIDKFLGEMEDHEKFIYLDNDIVFNEHPNGLVDALQDFEEPIAATFAPTDYCRENVDGYMDSKWVQEHMRLSPNYFNSGLMCFNVGAAKKQLGDIKIHQYYLENWRKYMFPDQDCLNILFPNPHHLAQTFNYQTEQLSPDLLNTEDQLVIRQGIRNSFAFHMSGKVKPWQWSNNDPYQDMIETQLDFKFLIHQLTKFEYHESFIKGIEWKERRLQGAVEEPLPSPWLTPFCHAPFTYFNYRQEGYRPCCSRHATPMKATGDWWNSPELREMRTKMFDPKTLPEDCRKCAKMKNFGPAQYAKKYNWKKYHPETGQYDGQPREVLVFLSNKCDLACEMCDSDHSDMHARTFPDRIIPVRNIADDDNFDIVTRFPESEVMTIMGGEPFMDKNFRGILERALTNNQHIPILTNGNRDLSKNAIFNELIVPNQHRMHLCFSIDGGEEDQRRIRLRINPERVIANIKLCLEKGMLVDVHYTLSKLNLHSFAEFLKYMRKEGLINQEKFQFNISHVDFPEDYHPSFASDEDFAKARESLKEIQAMDFCDCTYTIQEAIAEGYDLIEDVVNGQKPAAAS